MKRFYTLSILMFFVFGCSLLEDEKDVPKLESAEFYETGDAEYPVIAIDETQAIFGFSSNLNQLFAQLPNGDQWIVDMGNNGYPESLFIEKGSLKLLLLFSDFDGDLCNVAVINQTDMTTEYFYDIEFSDISRTSNLYAFAKNSLKSAGESNNDIMSWWDTYGQAVKKMAGPVLGGIGCGISAISAVGSGGVATPIAILSCGSFASSISGDIIGEESTAGGAMFKGGAVVGKYGEMVLKCGTQNWGSCALAISGEIGAIANLFKFGLTQSKTGEAKEHLQAYTQTGGLAGNWISEEIQIAGGSYQSEYYFGLNAGNYIQTNEMIGGGITTNTTTKLTFNYTISNNIFTTTITRIEIEVTSIQNGQTYTQKLGPLTWEEFAQTAEFQNGGFTEQSLSLNFEIKDGGQRLELSNGQIFTRPE